MHRIGEHMRKVQEVIPIPEFLQSYLPGNTGNFVGHHSRPDQGFQRVLDAEMEKLKGGDGIEHDRSVTN